MISKYSLGSHTTQPAGWKGRWTNRLNDDLVPQPPDVCTIWGNKDAENAAQRARAMAIPLLGLQGWYKQI